MNHIFLIVRTSGVMLIILLSPSSCSPILFAVYVHGQCTLIAQAVTNMLKAHCNSSPVSNANGKASTLCTHVHCDTADITCQSMQIHQQLLKGSNGVGIRNSPGEGWDQQHSACCILFPFSRPDLLMWINTNLTSNIAGMGLS